MHRIRARVAVALALLPAALAPAAAHANDPVSREPVLTLEGWAGTCTVGSGVNQGLGEVLKAPAAGSTTPYHPAFTAKGFNGLPADWIRAWVTSPAGQNPPKGYDQCFVSAHQLAGRLKSRIEELIAHAKTTDPTVNKVDLVGVSYGSTVSRLCIKHVVGCEALVDDWVGIVPPSHGVQGWGNCPFPYNWVCAAAIPGGSVVTDLNSGDETPGTIEYTTLRATNDGLIQPPGSERLTGAANWSARFPDTPAGATQHSTHQSVTGSGISGVVPPNGPIVNGKLAGTAVTCQGSPRTTQSGIIEALAAELADITDRSTWDLSTNTSFDLPLACWGDLLG